MHSCFLYDLKSRMHSGYSTQLSCKLPPAKEEVNVFVRVHLSVCLSVCLIARLLKNVWFYKKLSCRREVARCFVSVSSWLYCFNSIIPPAQFFLLLVTSASDLTVRTIRFCSVVFGVTSSLAVIHTIRSRPWLCIVRDRAWSVSHCGLSRVALGDSISALNKKPAAGAIYNHGAAFIDRWQSRF